MQILDNIRVRVAHADVQMQIAVRRSVRAWKFGRQDTYQQTLLGCNGDIAVDGDQTVFVEGDCVRSLVMPAGGVLHINGNLQAHIRVSGHCEVVISGNVLHGSIIDTVGVFNVFIGGVLAGEVRSAGNSKTWIDSDFIGRILTGDPAHIVHIEGDCRGRIVPGKDLKALWRTVNGVASTEVLASIAESGYLQFNASVMRSDKPPGVYYPTSGLVEKRGSNIHWCVRS